MGHLYEEYHEDVKIGRVMWRIDRRCKLLFYSQDGSQIRDLERKIASDKKELAELKAAYIKKETP